MLAAAPRALRPLRRRARLLVSCTSRGCLPHPRSPSCCSPPDSSSLSSTLYLGLLFGLWYAANIFFNIWNKQVLKAYAFPITGTFVQFGIGLCIACAMWLLRIKEAPKARTRARVLRGGASQAGPRKALWDDTAVSAY